MHQRARPIRFAVQPALGRTGATSLQLLVVIGIIAVLVCLLLPVVSKAREAARQAGCLENLRQLGVAFQMYGNDSGTLPYPAFTQIPWERSLVKYTSLGTFRCPSDAELAPATGSSYDWRDTGIPETTLAGKSLRSINRTGTALAFEALPGWHAQGRINVVRVDGSAGPWANEELTADMDLPVNGSAAAAPGAAPGAGPVPAAYTQGGPPGTQK